MQALRREADSPINCSSVIRVAAVAIIAAVLAQGAHRRSASELRAFKRSNPCPSTGERRGACPGFVIDHRQALCVGGRDEAANMMWMTVAAAKAKDRWECRPGWELKLRECDADRLSCSGFM